MSWVYVGLLAGSLVTSTHDGKEACEGRAVTLREKGVTGKCVEQSPTLSFLSGNIACIVVDNNGRCVR